MQHPAAMHIKFNVSQNMCARQGNGGAMEIKGSIDVCPGKHFWIASAAAE